MDQRAAHVSDSREALTMYRIGSAELVICWVMTAHLKTASVVKKLIGGVGAWVLNGRVCELLEAVTGALGSNTLRGHENGSNSANVGCGHGSAGDSACTAIGHSSCDCLTWSVESD